MVGHLSMRKTKIDQIFGDFEQIANDCGHFFPFFVSFVFVTSDTQFSKTHEYVLSSQTHLAMTHSFASPPTTTTKYFPLDDTPKLSMTPTSAKSSKSSSSVATPSKYSPHKQEVFTREFMVMSDSLYPIPLAPLKQPSSPHLILQKMHSSLSDQQSMKNILSHGKHPFAAVGMLIKQENDTLRILLTKRVESENDIFQGEVCLPGGMYQPHTDRSLFETVSREIHEELGIDVRRSCRFIGQIPSSDILRFRLNHGMLGVVVYAFEYLKGELVLKKDEVASAAWVDAAVFWRGRQEKMRRMYLPLAKVTTDTVLKRKVEEQNLILETSNVVFSNVRVVKGSDESCDDDDNASNPSSNEKSSRWMIWGLTLEAVMAVFQYGASMPPIFSFSLSSPDKIVNQVVQFNWAFSKAFMEASWNSIRGSDTARIIVDGVIREILRVKENKKIEEDTQLRSKM